MSDSPNKYFEPNDLEYNPEDLSVGISLSIQYLDRALVASTTMEGYVNILYGSENEKMLTTSYTDITILELEGGGNKESIGIENISIKYNTWYFPEVTIKFIDIRGNSIFNSMEMTNDSATKKTAKGSFLKGFFTFPYPIFYLTVKGFFGKPISYRLTVKDVPKAMFNSQTGNFELSVNFIGHMYYYLTDIPMSLLMLAPYIEYNGNDRKLGTFDGSETEIPTFIEFISDTAKTIKKINSDEEYNRLRNDYDDKNKILEKLEKLLRNFRDLDALFKECYNIINDANNPDKCTFERKNNIVDTDNFNRINIIIEAISGYFKDTSLNCSDLVFFKNENLYVEDKKTYFYNSEKDISSIETKISQRNGELQTIEDEIKTKEDEIIKNSYSYTPTLKDVIEITMSHLEKLRKNMQTCLNGIHSDSKNRKLSKIKQHKTDCNVINNEVTAFPFLSFLNTNGEYVWIGNTEANTFTERHFIDTVIKKTTTFQTEMNAAEEEFNIAESVIKNFPNTGLKSFIGDKGNVYKDEMNNDIVTYCKQVGNLLPPVFNTIAKRFVTSYFYSDVDYTQDILYKIEACKLLNCGFNQEVYSLNSVWGDIKNANSLVYFGESIANSYKDFKDKIQWDGDRFSFCVEYSSQNPNYLHRGYVYLFKAETENMYIYALCGLHDMGMLAPFPSSPTSISGWERDGVRYYYRPKCGYYYNNKTALDKKIDINLKTVNFLQENGIPIDDYINMFPIAYPRFSKIVSVTSANFIINGKDVFVDDANNEYSLNNIDTWCTDNVEVKFKTDKTIDFDNSTSHDICVYFFKECLKFERNYELVLESFQRGGDQLYSLASMMFISYARKYEWQPPNEWIKHNLSSKWLDLAYEYRWLDDAYKVLLSDLVWVYYANFDIYEKYKDAYAESIKEFFIKYYENKKLNNAERNFHLRKLLKMHVFVESKAYLPNVDNSIDILDLTETLKTAGNEYLSNFLKEMQNKIITNATKEDNRIDTSLADERKLSIYDIFKNLYDRWKYGAEEINGDTNKHNKITIQDFIFRDSLGRDISSELNVNVENIISILIKISKGEQNMTVYEFIHKVCSMADCLLLPLPSNVFSLVETKNKIKEIFTPYNYTHVINNETNSNFVITYRQKDSQHLNFSPNESSYADDGIDFTNETMVSNVNAGAFGVTYGFNKQRFFKNVQVSMDKPQVTEQSIATTLHIVENGEKNGSRKIGVSYHDIFDTFSNHSYQCTVEMMGNAQIMPMMYFQLNNIPFFKGGYMITSVEHEIKSGSMTTKFTGNRLNMNQFKIKNLPLVINVEETSGSTALEYSEIGGNFVSNYFTITELTYSSYANTHNLNNTPGRVEIKNLQKLATDILDKIRIKYGKPIIVNSAFRSNAVNKGVGGSKTSQHRKGEAADIRTINDAENGVLFKLIERMILDGELVVGQLIWEYGDCEKPDWIHVSLPTATMKNDLLRAKRDANQKTYYVAYVEC